MPYGVGGCECTIEWDAIDQCPLCAAAPEMLTALKEIAKGEGRFSRDPMTHAQNTIEDMLHIANVVIDKLTKAEGKTP